MARLRDDLADSFATEDTGSWLSRFLADEDDLDRRALWRLGSWAAGSVGALVLAFLASQSAIQVRRDQVAGADLAQQAQFIQRLARESQIENSRLASAIDTLNGDRDRAFSRLGSMEQELNSITGSIAKQNRATNAASAPSPAADKMAAIAPVQPPAPPPAAPVESAPPAPVTMGPAASATAPPKPSADKPAAELLPIVPTAPQPAAPQTAAAAAIRDVANKQVTLPAAPLMPPKSILAPPDPAAGKLVEPEAEEAAKPKTASAKLPAETDIGEPAVPAPRTAFGVDLGAANTVDGLRAMWRRLAGSHKSLAPLRPIIMVRERAKGGPQLRLVAGPLNDAAAAAKLCASLGEGDVGCETSVFDGQRLPTGAPAASSRPSRKRAPAPPKVTAAPEPPPPQPEPKTSSLTSFLGLR